MTLFEVGHLKVTSQDIIETKLGDLIEATLNEELDDFEGQDPIVVTISGKEENMFDMTSEYTVNLVTEFPMENDMSDKYKVMSLNADIGLYCLQLRRELHPDDPKDNRYEEINISGLVVTPELLSIKAGDYLFFGIRKTLR